MSERTWRFVGAAALFIVATALAARAEEATVEESSPPAEAASDSSEESELLALLAEETDIATKTKMNSDFVPGIVSVLHGEELEALGVHTVWEALSMVPGIQIGRDMRGSPYLTVRGIDFIFNTGNVKVLVNDISMSRESAGVNNSVLLLPIEQVERIEVIRGPGSAIHGDFAFSGLINIVTKKDEGRALLKGQDPNAWIGVVEDQWTSKGGVTTSMSVSGLTSGDAEVPEPREAEEERRAALLAVEGKFGRFQGQYISRDMNIIDEPGAPTDLNEENWALSWDGRFDLGEKWSIGSEVVHSDTEHDLRPQSRFNGDMTSADVDFMRDGERHDTLIGVSYWTGDVDFGQIPTPPPGPPRIVMGDSREIWSVTFQEMIQATDALSITIGARWDELSDIGTEISPRLALVWRMNEKNVLKAQYAEAFRAPTFFEMEIFNPDPEAEQMSSTELGWIRRTPNTVLRTTAFHSELDDGLGPPSAPVNSRHATVSGVEVEWTQTFGDVLKLISNVSYVDQAEGSMAFAYATWMGNLALVGNITDDMTLAARWYHVDQRETPEGLGLEFEGYDWVDLTWAMRNAGVDGLDFSVGVKNILDEEFIHPMPLPAGIATLTYEGRCYWASIAYRW